MSEVNKQPQVGGTHYRGQSRSGQQHWDVAADFNLDYFQGVITKYVMRWREKNGLEDLRKARQFLDKYIEDAEIEARAKELTADERPLAPVESPSRAADDAPDYTKDRVETELQKQEREKRAETGCDCTGWIHPRGAYHSATCPARDRAAPASPDRP
jgi:hypothetical protein